MRDDPPRFGDRGTAVIYAAGLRLLSGDENPASMTGWIWTLVEDGHAIKLRFPTKCGMMVCIADLPAKMTDRELLADVDWFAHAGDDPDQEGELRTFMHMKCAGSA